MIRSVSAVPVLVITARDDEAEIVRIRAVLRRAEAGVPKAKEPLEVGRLRLDARA